MTAPQHTDREVSVVCGFPGVGKSHLCASTGWADSDSSKFSWIAPGVPGGAPVRNPTFPLNYISHIKNLKKTTTGMILVSTHSIVRAALREADVGFILCYPERRCKEEYAERYARRGSPQTFIDLLHASWDTWIDEMEAEAGAAAKVILKPGKYISDAFFARKEA